MAFTGVLRHMECGFTGINHSINLCSCGTTHWLSRSRVRWESCSSVRRVSRIRRCFCARRQSRLRCGLRVRWVLRLRLRMRMARESRLRMRRRPRPRLRRVPRPCFRRMGGPVDVGNAVSPMQWSLCATQRRSAPNSRHATTSTTMPASAANAP